MGNTFKFIAFWGTLLLAGSTLAQVKCTMPNGKTITLQNAKRCAADATRWETLDGQDITPPDAPKPRSAIPPSPKKIDTYIVEHKRAPTEKNPMDTALEICAALKKTTSAWCSVAAANGRFQAFSTIKIWDNITSSAEASSICKTIASSAHDFSGGSMRKNYWRVEVFSKHSTMSSLAICNI